MFKLLSSGMVYVEISLASPSAVGLNAVAPLVVVVQWWFCPVGCRCAVVVLPRWLSLCSGGSVLLNVNKMAFILYSCEQ